MFKKFNLVKNYIIHFFKAGNEHSLHSPFLFEFYKAVIREKSTQNFEAIEKQRKKLLADNSEISITDFGAGSLVDNPKKRKIKDIARNSLTPKSQTEFLAKIVSYLKPKTILELGTSLGITTTYLSKANSDSNIYTIEGCPNISNIAKSNFKDLNIENIELRTGNIDDVLPNILSDTSSVDLVFFDGNHTKEATLNYFNMCVEKVNNDTLFIFDDIYWTKGMQEAWEEIVQNDKCTLTLDFFYFGLVFFRKNQPKQHFYLRM